jgi:hypothetical protein
LLHTIILKAGGAFRIGIHSFVFAKLFCGFAKCHLPSNRLEEAMGYKRHVSQALAAHASLAIEKERTPSADVWRQARQMRNEWRQRRYSRLISDVADAPVGSLDLGAAQLR